MSQGQQESPAEWQQAQAVDRFLDNLESLVTAIEQRQLSEAQLERLALILARAERIALRTAKVSRAGARMGQ